jgi:hypothetical protein
MPHISLIQTRPFLARDCWKPLKNLFKTNVLLSLYSLADPLRLEGGKVALRIKHLDLGPTAVDHVHDVVDRHRAFRNVGSDDDLPAKCKLYRMQPNIGGDTVLYS